MSDILSEYQLWTRTTAFYPKERGLEYLALGLSSEAGEVAGDVKKWIRDGQPLNNLKKELGDCLYYLCRIADELGYDIYEVAQENRAKLEDRKIRGTLKGNGNNR